MAKLLANRWFRWTLLASALSGLGVGIYRFTPPQPRWEIDATTEYPGGMVQANASIVTFQQGISKETEKNNYNHVSYGPIRVLDCMSGKETARFLDASKEFFRYEFSRDRRYFAAEVVRVKNARVWVHEILLIDFLHAKSIPIPQNVFCKRGQLEFSPNGKYLGHFNGTSNSLEIYETATAKVIGTRRCSEWQEISDEFAVYSDPNGAIEVYDLAHGKLAMSLDKTHHYQRGWIQGECLSTVQSDQRNPNKQKCILWNIRGQRLEREVCEFELKADQGVGLSIDGNVAMLKTDKPNRGVQLFELPSGRSLGFLGGELSWLGISPNGKLLVVHWRGENPSLGIVELSTMRTLWKAENIELFPPPIFSGDSSTVFAWNVPSGELCAFECGTGKRLLSMSLPQSLRELNFPMVRATASRPYVLVHQRHGSVEQNPAWKFLCNWIPILNRDPPLNNDIVTVMDTPACRERFRIDGLNVAETFQSDDGNILVTGHGGERPVIRCWDVNAWKPLHWALGVPAGLSAVIGLFAWRRGRRKAA